MNKKVIGIFATMGVMAGATSFATTFTDVDENSDYSKAIQNLVSYDILAGYDLKDEMGNVISYYFNPDGGVTRAEMAKIAVMILGKDDEIAYNNKATGFSDVVSYHWANSYINICNSEGIIKGYADGRFVPSGNLTYAEAITIVLRTLGYGTDVLGGNWPDAYISKAYELELLDGIQISDVNANITRKELVKILDKALVTDKYNSNQKLIQNMEYSVSDECVILSVGSGTSGIVKTTAGQYKKGDVDVKSYIGQMVNIVYDTKNDNKIIAVVPTSQDSEEIIVSTATSNAINNKSIDSDVVVYVNSIESTYENAWTLINKGDTVMIFYSNNDIDYIAVKDVDLEGPFKVSKLVDDSATLVAGISIKPGVTVIRDGETVNLSDICLNDIVYYNSNANILTVYKDKITGVYESASPSKSDVKIVNISGKDYEIETTTATNKLNESVNAYKINDKITVALGKDGKIVDVIESGSSDIEGYAIVIESHSEESTDEETKGSIKYYATLVNMDEQEVTYESTRDLSGYIAKLVNYDFDNDGKLVVTKIENKEEVYGDINQTQNKIGVNWINKNAKIIDLVSSNSNSAEVKFIDLSDIEIDTLDEDDVLKVVKGGDFDDIQILYLDDVSGVNSSYGIVTNYVESSSINGEDTGETYQILINGNKMTFAGTSKIYKIYTNSCVKLETSGSQITDMEELERYKGGEVEAIDETRIKIDNKVYRLSDNVVVYKKQGGTTYKKVSIYDIEKGTSALVYGDEENSSLVRIIII